MTGEFKAGDVVTLNSGGSDMTVEEVRGANVDCVWFDYFPGTGSWSDLKKATFRDPVLKKKETKDGINESS
jgi:uncharacterized protein YodC (DUF2158 family)